jgi:4-hydroxybenzoate polyprenyltransferase
MTDSFAGLFPMSVGRDGKFSGFLFKVFDHIFILRFMLIIPVWTVLLLGFYHSGSGLPFTWRMFAIAAAATGLAGAVFVFNQIFDIESDRINDKVYFLPKKYVTITAAYILYLVLNIISLVIAFMVSAIAGFLGGAILLLGAAYSAPPFVIKDRPWLGFLANATGHGTLVFLLGYCSLGGDLGTGILKSLPYFLSVAAVYIGTTLADREGDQRTGKMTLAVVMGINRSIYFLTACYFMSVAAAFIVKDVPFLWAALAVCPFYIRTFIDRGLKSSLIAIKLSIVSLSIASAYFYPSYFVFLLAVILLTRVYYKKRFGIDYPALG